MRAQQALLMLCVGCAPATLTITPLNTDEPVVEPDPENRVPTAFAGQDQRVPVGTPLEWSVGGTLDPDGDELSLSWTVVEAPPGSRAVPRQRADLRVAFDPDVVGDFVLELVVNDGRGGVATDDVYIESVDTWALGGGRPAPGGRLPLGRDWR